MTSTSLSANPVMVGALGLILATGVFLARTTHPYGTGLLTVHKLAAVGIIVFVAIRARHTHLASGLTGIAWSVLITGAIAFAVMIGTGGALSAMDNPPAAVATVHKFGPYLAACLTIAALCLIPVRTS